MKKPPAFDNEKLNKYLEKSAQFAARAKAEQAKLNAVQRKRETREKILIGSALITEANKSPKARAFIEEILIRTITLDRNREELRFHGWTLRTDKAAD